MADIVNLRSVRKRKARAAKAQSADENRASHGRPKSERDAAFLADGIERRRHEGHRRSGAAGDPDEGSSA